MNKWKPIETAPKDRYILVYAPVNINSIITGDYSIHQVVMAKWDNYFNSFCVFGTFKQGESERSSWTAIDVRNATHWMPLPEPPE